jgi:hypothetical protein
MCQQFEKRKELYDLGGADRIRSARTSPPTLSKVQPPNADNGLRTAGGRILDRLIELARRGPPRVA